MMATADKPNRTRSKPPTVPPIANTGKIPAPIDACPGEPVSHTRTRALQIAEYHGLIGLFIGPIDAATVEPTRLTYWYLPAGMTLEDLKRGQEPYVLEAAEVLPFLFGLALAAGIPDELRYRDGLPR